MALVDDGSGQFWRDGDGRWTTDYPPPPGFDLCQHGTWGDRRYSRHYTNEEAAVLDRLERADMADALAAAAAERDATLAGMAAEISSLDDLLPPPRSA